MNETTSSKYNNCLDIFNPEFDKQPKIVIIGAWWIGCWTTFTLAQMWFNDITVVDFDEVEMKNTSSQLYKESDIGMGKVRALWQNVKNFTGIQITEIMDRFKPEYVKDADIVISAVDNMATRREVIEACTIKTKRFIDCRMMSMAFEIYSYIPVYENSLYFRTWFPDEEATAIACTNKSSSFNTFAIAGFLTRIVVGIVKDELFILKRSQLTVDLSNLLIW